MQHCHHSHPESPLNAKAIVEDCIHRIRALGMRRTRALECVLGELANENLPLTIGDLAQKPSLHQQCDPATIYRLVERLQQVGILRKLGLHERAMFYEINLPGHHRDYLICHLCGSISDINEKCPVEQLEQELIKKTGYSNIQHDLVFYGECPDCVIKT